MSVAVLEAGDGIGGVWYWNRYPGARCDVESYDYSYAFSEELEQQWRWSERYATQPEILRYIEHVADRFDLRRDVHLRQRMTRAEYDAAGERWHVITEKAVWSGRYLVMAVGNLSTTKEPTLPGQNDFRGRVLHTARWPHDGVDFTGKRVGVIGTGSSGMQMIPVIAPEVEHLTVFQRTPNFSIPAANALHHRRAGRAGQARLPGAASRRAELAERAGIHPEQAVRPGRDRGGTPRVLRERVDAARVRVSPRLLRPLARPGGKRHRRRLHPGQDRRTGARPGHTGEADAARLPVRHQAPLGRQRLLPDVQPRQRHPGRHPRGSHPAPGRDRAAHHAGATTTWTSSCSPRASTR